MLSLQALQSAQPLANMLDARNLIVRPVGGSVLAKLAEVSYTDENIISGDRGAHQVDLSLLADYTNQVDTVSGAVLHSQHLDEVVTEVAEAVTRHLSFARTVVAPTVDDLVQRVAPAVEEAMRSDMTQLEVEVYRLPAPMYEPSLVDSFMRATDVVTDNYAAGMGFPAEVNVVTIAGYCQSGVPGLDEAITQYVEKLGGDTLFNIYMDLFTPKSSGRHIWDLFNEINLGLDYALVGFLITRKLWDNPPEGVDMSAAAYEAEMVRLRNQCALRLIHEMRRMERDETNGILVRSYTTEKVTVNEQVYRKFLDGGGDHCILFGNVLSFRPRVTVNEILENNQEFKSIWDRHVMLSRTLEANKRFNTAKMVIRTEFDGIMRDVSVDVVPMQDRQMVNKLFNDALAGVREDEVKDLYALCLRLLCSSMFHKTDAYRILEGINQVKQHSPDVDVREAAAISAISYISHWVSSQFQVDNAVR